MTSAANNQATPRIQLPSCFETLKQWTERNTCIATITTVAFYALGATLFAATFKVTATVSLAILLGIGSLLCLGTALTLSKQLIRQVIEYTKSSPSPFDLHAKRIYRKQIMKETLQHLQNQFYHSPDGTRHTLDLRPAAQGTQLLLSAGAQHQRPGSETTQIQVRNQDCLLSAADLHGRGLNPIVLDMANAIHFGGGYLSGALAQEEECCRRTGLSYAVDTRWGIQTNNFYPLNHPSHEASMSAGLYVPHVPVFRAGADQNYQCMNHPFNVAFGIIAAQERPSLDSSSGKLRLTSTDANITKERIRTFFEMAYRNGHRSVVFGALGCGAFGNPPDHIAELTMEVLTNEFVHCFKEVVIAIIEDHNSRRSHNNEGNFLPFARRVQNSGGKAFDAEGNQLLPLRHS